MKTLPAICEFTRGYLVAALWTWDDNAPSGQYESSGRINELMPLFHASAIVKACDDCRAFLSANDTDVEIQAELMGIEQAGHDFWLTRNRHGSGFWDRCSLPDNVADRLTEAAHGFGEVDLYEGDDGKLYFS